MSIRTQTLIDVAQAFSAAQVDYVIVGGMAVVAHGYLRATQDLDLVIDLETEACKRGLKALEGLGFQPRAPVDLLAFADPEQRASWQADKDMLVFTVWREVAGRQEQIDLFIQMPFDLKAAAQEALRKELPNGGTAAFVDLQRLRKMKQEAGRLRDLDDIDHLNQLHGDHS